MINENLIQSNINFKVKLQADYAELKCVVIQIDIEAFLDTLKVEQNDIFQLFIVLKIFF